MNMEYVYMIYRRYNIKVITLVRYNIVPKTRQKPHGKNSLKIP